MSTFLFIVFPYVAVILAVGAGIHLFRMTRSADWSVSPQLLEDTKRFWGSAPWHCDRADRWDRTFISLLDTASRSSVNIRASSIPRGRSRLDLNSWASSFKQTLAQVGVHFAVERFLKMGDETVVCLGDKDSMLGRQLRGVSSWMCMSSGGLSLDFLGSQADVRQFDAIVQGVRRK